MPNAWIEHIKSWSRKHNVSYGCALSMPECKNAYHSKKPQAERGMMGQEDISAMRNREALTKKYTPPPLSPDEEDDEEVEVYPITIDGVEYYVEIEANKKGLQALYNMDRDNVGLYNPITQKVKWNKGFAPKKSAPKKSEPKKSEPKKSEPKKDKRGIPFANMMQVEEREKMSLDEYQTKYASGYKVFKDIYGNIVTYEPDGKLIGDTRTVIFPEYNSPSNPDIPYQINFRRGIDDNEFPVKYAKQYKEYYDAKRNGFTKANIDVRTEEGRKKLSQLEDRITKTMLYK